MIKKRVSQSNRDTLFLFLLTHKQNERAFFENCRRKSWRKIWTRRMRIAGTDKLPFPNFEYLKTRLCLLH